jgi:uncharacterized Zn-finger protein
MTIRKEARRFYVDCGRCGRRFSYEKNDVSGQLSGAFVGCPYCDRHHHHTPEQEDPK